MAEEKEYELIMKIMSTTETAHQKADNEMSKIDNVCQKGCNACCHQIVEVYTWEEPKIFQYIENRFTPKQKKQLNRNLKQWFKRFNRNTRPADGTNPLTPQEMREVERVFREERFACPFLMGTSCSIYEARPLVCRVHHQTANPDGCRSNPHRDTPSSGQNIFVDAAEAFDPAVFPKAMKPLAYLVAQDYAQDIKSKPMERLIYDPNNVFVRE